MKIQHAVFSLILAIFFISPAQKVSAQETNIPNPDLKFAGKQGYTQNGKRFSVFRLSVNNWKKFPDKLFEPAPNLPPCGQNTNSSRTWVDIYDDNEKRIYGFCAIKTPEQLFDSLAFSIPEDEKPPARVFIVILDRENNKIYKSKKIALKKD